jgi:hypothetical protein
MDDSYFSVMAQLSGVILGFANLANAIYKPNIKSKDINLNKIRILVSTEVGLFVIIVCIIPILFRSTSISPTLVIKVLSLVLMVSVPSYAYMITTRSLKLMDTRFPVPIASKLFVYSGFTCGVFGGLNAFEIFGSGNVFFIYQFMIFGCFLVQSFLFIRLIRWILSNQGMNE